VCWLVDVFCEVKKTCMDLPEFGTNIIYLTFMHLQDCNSYTNPGLISTSLHMSTLVRNYLNSHEQPTDNIDFL
jgi:hypothetical protein